MEQGTNNAIVSLDEGDLQMLGDSSTSNAVNTPQIGMHFSSEQEASDFYKSYAQCLGFSFSKLGSKKDDDGQLKYLCFGCSKQGKHVSRRKTSFYPRPSIKTNCKAKINITVQNDGLFVITSMRLEHNHPLSPGKSRHFRCNKVLDSETKRKLELNDQAGITLSKSFKSIVVEADGFENLPFDERKCQNYVVETRRLRLENGDAEASKIIYDDSCNNEEDRRRRNNLQPLLMEVSELGSKNDESFFILTEILKDAKQRLMNLGDSLDGDHGDNITHGQPKFQKNFYSPLKVRSRGRPPMKRRQSKIEQVVKKTTESTVVRRQEEFSGFNPTNSIDDQSSQNVIAEPIVCSTSQNES